MVIRRAVKHSSVFISLALKQNWGDFDFGWAIWAKSSVFSLAVIAVLGLCYGSSGWAKVAGGRMKRAPE